eukprot:CAMPEP_0172600352 /NCGR_PEP_ID=MMETSP1068-20121228/20529_1 /TAXON_ID=35684 /ORGANISM="Pseudopedinella elastica, Strain CCMP716" /LENGTH=636 /DNA_ID=CAMNT_0013400981 /DNA_START=113 /DNA_END=2023 /DNA_ORIENTATION=+
MSSSGRFGAWAAASSNRHTLVLAVSAAAAASILFHQLRGSGEQPGEPAAPSEGTPPPPAEEVAPSARGLAPLLTRRSRSTSVDHADPGCAAFAKGTSFDKESPRGGGSTCSKGGADDRPLDPPGGEGGPDVGAIFGLDCGGSLAKLAYFEQRPVEPDSGSTTMGGDGGGNAGGGASLGPPPPLGSEKSTRVGLGMTRSRSLAALDKGPPMLRRALRDFYAFMARKIGSRYVSSTVHESALSFECPQMGGTLHFLHFETRDMGDVCKALSGQRLTRSVAKLGCTGGGAHKYRQVLEESLEVKVEAIDEMESLVRGIEFVIERVVGECYTYRPRDELVDPPCSGSSSTSDPTLAPGSPRTRRRKGGWGTGASPPAFERQTSGEETWSGEKWSCKVARPVSELKELFPYLLVNIGSGVSVIRVDGPDGQFQRVSGSSVGGGTFFGLGRLLTGGGRESFEELLLLAMRGDARRCDMMVGDIYGHDYSKMGLPSDVVASSFGKCMNEFSSGASSEGGQAGGQLGSRPEDRLRALLMMVTNNIAQVAYLNAKQHATPRIYFIGNFLRQNVVSFQRLSYAIDYWSGSRMEALFLEHEGYFGALGAFVLSNQQTGAQTSNPAEKPEKDETERPLEVVAGPKPSG